MQRPKFPFPAREVLTAPELWAARAAWGVAIAGALASIAVGPSLPAYLWMWVQIGLAFLGLKSIVVARADQRVLRQIGAVRLLGFVFLWPGMDLRPFWEASVGKRVSVGGSDTDEPAWKTALWGAINSLAGMVLIALSSWPPLRSVPYLEAAVGLGGLGLVVLYGIFDLLTAFWRASGVRVQKQWRFLPASQSLADYWSTRWNRAFHDFARDYVYLPLKRRCGSAWALGGSFFFSGLLHELIISVPARGGFGLPTMYFVLQGLGIWLERRLIRSSVLRRVWATLFVLAPLALLFHVPFIYQVVLPQLAAIRRLVYAD